MTSYPLSALEKMESPPIGGPDTPVWLQEWRCRQWQEFRRCGFPQRREESWRYTALTALLDKNFSFVADTDHQRLSFTLDQCLSDSYRLVFINGIFSPQHSLLTQLPAEVILIPCKEVIARYPALYQQIVCRDEPTKLSVFQWLNGAVAENGLFLSIPDHCQLSKPIHLLSITDIATPWMQHPQHFIRLGVDSSANILEEYRGSSMDDYFTNGVTRIVLQQNSQLNYCKLQHEGPRAFHIANTLVEQAQDSHFFAHHLALGAKLHRDDLQFVLRQRGASCKLSGFYYPQAGQLIDFHTRIDHEAPLTTSKQFYKGMIGAEGCGVFNGKIVIHPGAQRAAAVQNNHNWLLAESAEIDTKPELEVLADDVQCTHGATVGSLAEEALFYLRSRGVTEQTARYLLMRGFAEETLTNLLDRQIADYVRKSVVQALANCLEENEDEVY